MYVSGRVHFAKWVWSETVLCYSSYPCWWAGTVLYTTTPDEPSIVVSRLRHRQQSEAVLLGKYSMAGDVVGIGKVTNSH